MKANDLILSFSLFPFPLSFPLLVLTLWRTYPSPIHTPV